MHLRVHNWCLGFMAKNPLAEAQRESAGASTFGKYNFQYHWALCEIIAKHQQKEEYALLIEYHEDVVIADNLDGNKANFEFYQVKNQQTTYTENSLTKRKRGANGVKSSVLGKLLSSCIGKQYEDRITKIGLVSSSGFNLDIDGELKLDVIGTGDLTEDCLKALTEKIDQELGISVLPEHLYFIVPEIQLLNQEDYVLSRFAKLVDALFPGAQCNAIAIYRAVIDEMGRIGRLEFDYKDWDRLIGKKSLTSEQVNQVLSQNSSHPSVDDIKADFDHLAHNLGWQSRQTRTTKKKLSQLALRRAGFMTALDMGITDSFRASFCKVDADTFGSDSEYLGALIAQANKDGLLSKVQSSDDLMLEVIYCFLTSEL